MSDITLRKDIRGNWRASQRIDLGNQRVLNIVTHKVSSGAFVTSASVAKVDGGFETHVMYQDFSKRLGAKSIRGTEKAVQALHTESMLLAGGLDALVNLAKAHYA
jgi:hypothetical protein